MRKLSHIKRIRLHNEGKYTLFYTGLSLALLNTALFFLLRDLTLFPFYVVLAISLVVYGIIINFFRCPIRRFTEATENTVVARLMEGSS